MSRTTTMITGGRRLPTHHITIRVPWHDSAWNGTVCQGPAANTSCLILKRIAEERDDVVECKYAGKPLVELPLNELPPCVDEHATVLSPASLVLKKRHPYAVNNPDTHGHVQDTPLELRPHSAACVPFRWMLMEEVTNKSHSLGLDFQPDREPELPFESAWVQEHDNQRIMLDTFFSALKPDESLCFLYAKRTPLSEDARRVIVGVGRVKGVGEPIEYKYSTTNPPLRSSLWERNVSHSIRPGFEDGFILPYQEILKLASEQEGLNPAEFLAFAPEEQFDSYSFGSELLSHDGAVASLLAVLRALTKIADAVPGPWAKCQKWVNDELNRLWAARGPFPGLGSALTALGVERGTLVACELARAQEKAGNEYSENPWELVEALVEQPVLLGQELAGDFGEGWAKVWKKLGSERRALLELLSRFTLSAEQASAIYVSAEREKAGITVSDAELLANPYLLYELSRHWPDPIPFAVVDRGLFPDGVVRERFPVPAPSAVSDAVDERRVRAAVVQVLEQAASMEGHTVLPESWLILRAKEQTWEPGLPLTEDILPAVRDSFVGVVDCTETAQGKPAYQLARYNLTRTIIANEVSKRVSERAKPHQSDTDWAKLLEREFKQLPIDAADAELERRAREEKAAALRTVFESRMSVLIGPAGTGKTTLLKLLCSLDAVRDSGVLLLAPTGKARVRLEQAAEQTGKGLTLAQFLLRHGRYDGQTGRYLTDSKAPKADGYGTVIVDECSMLTEEQLASLLGALKGVKRYILVGDPRQLPPIGAGRPFVDVVRKLAPAGVETEFPRVGRGYAELTIPRRQKGGVREDVVLASWFAGTPLEPAADRVWHSVPAGRVPEVRTVEWSTDAELQRHMVNVLVEELQLNGPDDEVGFEVSYGGTRVTTYDSPHAFFNNRYKDRRGAGECAEDWQVLSPVRPGQVGVDAINRELQSRFRRAVRDLATTEKHWLKVPRPFGAQQILYGDKVINVVNARRFDVWPRPDGEAYVSNGDIGVAIGQYKTRKSKFKGNPKKLEVEFAAQPGTKFGFGGRDFSEEGTAALELAYALTVHKTQGSQFRTTFVVLPNPCWLLSRELIYTALTRHQDRVVIFHQRPLTELRAYAQDQYSEIARRLTNLFDAPAPTQIEMAHGPRFLEDRLIHRTERGELVRSKSELVIADKLFSRGIDYSYERELKLGDGVTCYPDFTIEDEATGALFFWEHLGMLSDPSYKRRWEAKLEQYIRNGIKPHEGGGGENGTLLITKDEPGGALDASVIASLIDDVLQA